MDDPPHRAICGCRCQACALNVKGKVTLCIRPNSHNRSHWKFAIPRSHREERKLICPLLQSFRPCCVRRDEISEPACCSVDPGVAVLVGVAQVHHSRMHFFTTIPISDPERLPATLKPACPFLGHILLLCCSAALSLYKPVQSLYRHVCFA